ncbi:ABC transporter substrate-binding protein [Corynebacterium pygosceleis]|uniref:ABC transporter substrate-binding protein n=1 Tax=Corynebacterium pygosceleis TaxID=2800406 RepID=A0A9Q4C8D1_9CORY|nr:ABC transporter substrate-binding protein [Corynebacterium pygosceleis]MCK7637688.1 ABC transporter substrate-binding protein [Corynebacterium pygosceleis]MCK7674879.1 ABC transporter substrate-binding protein [Corynebacterium pygosceleis]MCL0119532.1 ABC transporter substrate-binding protein [Corynebacterium pygosceleis]MCX7467983.1 ABC transporter substrate-binding protein [Corynebacterium pygosceleis]
MTIRFNRRAVTAVAATAFLATGALTACSSDSDDVSEKAGDAVTSGSSAASSAAKEATSSDAEGRGPITFAMGKNDTDKLKPVIEKWNAEHPDEKVTLKELAGEADEQADTLKQALQAKSTDYDVMALDVIWTAEFAANQWLEPLEGDMAVDTSGLLQSTVDSATYVNKLYAVPQNTNGQLLFRNTALVPEAPENFGELAEDCKEVSEQDKDCLTLQLKKYEGLTVNTVGFIEGWGGHVIDSDEKPVVDSDDSKAGLQALVDAYDDGVIASDSISATEEETNLAFTEGRTAFAINWPYMYGNAEKDNSAVKGEFEVQPLVAKDGVGVSTLGGYNNAVSAYSENKLTARDFIEFIISEENQMSFAEASFPPVLASIYDDEDLIEKFPYMPALKISLENAVPRPVSPFYPAISKAIQDNSYAALTGEKSVDDAASDMQAAMEQSSR